jgi:Ca2+-binding EF-hand superfamily protein
MEELDVLVKRFNADRADLAAWTAEKKAYTDKAVDIDTLLKAQHARVVHQAFDEEYAGRAQRVAALEAAAAKIGELDYADKAAIGESAGEARAAYDALKGAAAAKAKAIEAGLASEQAKEDARLDFAAKAKDFARQAAIAQQEIADRTFGFTLATVQAHGAALDASDAAHVKAADAALAAVKAADEQCAKLHTGANPHTKLTLNNSTASRKAVGDAIAARRADYAAELAKQQRWDAARKAFAGDADAFVAWLGEQRKAVQSAAGEPDARIAAIKKKVHRDGKPGADRVAALAATADKNAADGVVGNDYTGLTVPLLKERNEQFNKYVAQALKSQDEEKVYNARFSELAAALKKAEEKELEQFDFQRAAKVLLHWLEAEGAFLTEPVAGNTVEDVEAAKAELAAFNAALAGKEADYSALQAKAKAVSDGALLGTVTAKWDETKQLATRRAEALGGELATQQQREKLRKEFAADAEKFHKWLAAQTDQLANTKGDLEAQKQQLTSLSAANVAGEAQVAHLQQLSVALDAAGVTDNAHTNLTADQLKREYEQLVNATKHKQSLVEQEIAKKQDSGVTPAQLQEFRDVFAHFDKDRNGKLESYELKACLNSLGDDPTDAEIKALEDKFKTGTHIEFEGFCKLMIDRASDKDTEAAILDSWRVIANDKDYVTEQDMNMASMPTEKVAYLKANMPKQHDGYDYKAWTKISFGGKN